MAHLSLITLLISPVTIALLWLMKQKQRTGNEPPNVEVTGFARLYAQGPCVDCRVGPQRPQ